MPGDASRPGWHADPVGRFEYRFHNGHNWTADVSTNGTRYVDPLGSSASASVGAGSGSGLAVASMILGIVGVTLAWLPFVFVIGTICAALAVTLGAIAVRRSTGQGTGRAQAVTGLATGSAGLLLSIVGITLSVVVFRAVERYDRPAEHEARLTSCTLDGSTASAVGEIRNLGDAPADFVLTVAFARAGTDNVHRSARAEIDDLAPGGTATFDVTREVGLDEVDCRITGVTGPLPFGLDIGT